MPLQSEITTRIRSQLNEGTARFFSNLELLGWYSDGAAQQHRIVLEMASQANRLSNVAHPYLRKYAKHAHINVTAGTSFYALPTDFLNQIELSFTDASGLAERDAIEQTGSDWWVKNIPHLAPTYARPAYGFRINPATNLPAIELFVFGDNGQPFSPGVIRLYYYRDMQRISAEVPSQSVDCDDPFNEGPVWYAVGIATLKRGLDPTGYLALADRCAQNIVAPMVAGSAVSKQAEGQAAAHTVKAGIERDTR